MSMGGGKDYDVIIVGGGPAGASASVHLATRGARVLLLEREKFPRPKLCGEFISPECLGHFARLGVLEEMLSAGGAQIAETQFLRRAGGGQACRAHGSVRGRASLKAQHWG
jgi:2-polyprenyl-6-methoxyphenol hydroxylase-like FAD-dependent oxidoreductase